MPYNKALDKEIISVVIGADEMETEGLKVGVFSYNGGEAKLQIGPRFYTKKNGAVGFRKAGRLSADEMVELAEVMPRLADAMDGTLEE